MELVAALAKIPFTLTLVTALIIAAIWTKTHRAALPEADLRDYGYAPRHLWRLAWRRIFTSIFLTVGGWRLYASLLAAGLLVGVLEWNFGTWPAVVLFFAIHALTLVIEAVVIVAPLRYFQHPLGETLHGTHDVGPSAGYYGCFGGWLSMSGDSMTLIGIVALYLSLRVLFSLFFAAKDTGDLPADTAHLVAFALGLALGDVWPA
ncbi:hypothetical protein Enr8_17970 [Blastopirellula retiformator]|uniref:Rhomboid family protein n=2 Tax=Blastopirellula retiformator TaxID=2527970 RepID=A0A5C5V959_9BACT|nr:hypothetical protein Enr8_17970 [Blastopirellula retiformator]